MMLMTRLWYTFSEPGAQHLRFHPIVVALIVTKQRWRRDPENIQFFVVCKVLGIFKRYTFYDRYVFSSLIMAIILLTFIPFLFFIWAVYLRYEKFPFLWGIFWLISQLFFYANSRNIWGFSGIHKNAYLPLRGF